MGDMTAATRFVIPKVLLKTFVSEPRIVIKWRPDGLWPVDPHVLLETDLLRNLVQDEAFQEQFEIVIMHR